MPLTIVLPHLADLVIARCTVLKEQLVIEAGIAGDAAPCPACGGVSGRVHSRYWRTIADLPIAERQTSLHLRVRRFRCANPACPRVTFAEQVPTLAARYARRSQALATAQAQFGLALGGRPGQRLSRVLRLPTGRMTLLRAVRALPDPAAPTPRILGVDDFALARGRRYGTVLLDLETRRPIDLLPDRTAAAFAAWLAAHPGITVICRDRGGSYASGARQGAPEAIQVADRFHLMQNLAEALERLVSRLHPGLSASPPASTRPVDPAEEPLAPEPAPPDAPSARANRIPPNQRSRHAAVQALITQGVSISAAARLLHLDRKTVRRYANSPNLPTEAAPSRRRRCLLDPYTAYLARRWQEGCRKAATLCRELRAQGYRGSATTVRAFVAPFRDQALPLPQRPPSVRAIVGLLVRQPAALGERDEQRLAALLAQHEDLAAAYRLARAFATLLHEREGTALRQWVEDVTASGCRELCAFAHSLEGDWDAVVAGLTLAWSSGPVEGHVNRIKLVKRQMFGRAKLDLLRRRVVLTG